MKMKELPPINKGDDLRYRLRLIADQFDIKLSFREDSHDVLYPVIRNESEYKLAQQFMLLTVAINLYYYTPMEKL